MNKTYEKEYSLRGSDFDKFDNIKPSAVLDLFQDIASLHAEILGVGFKDMLERSYLWVLTRIKFKILSAPKPYENVLVKTWPLKPGRLNYQREYCICNTMGEKLIVGSSEWVVIDTEKRRLVSAPNLYPFSEGFCEEKMFQDKLGKIADFTDEENPYVVNAGFSMIDANNHVNNINYANFSIDALSPERPDVLETFQIDYRKEVLQGTTLFIHKTKEEKTALAKGKNDTGDTMFLCKLEYK